MSVDSVTNTTIAVSFDSIPRASYYEVVWRLANSSTTLGSAFVYDLSYTITGLTAGTQYAINYKAWNSNGDGPWMATPVYATTAYNVYATITYDPNGGTGGPGTQTVTGTTTSSSGANIWFTIPSTVPTRNGYTFAGWLFPSGYTWQPGDSTIIWATPSGTNYTATAQWTQGGAQVYIDNGTDWDEYRATIDNGTGWDDTPPNIDNGTNWG